MADTIGAEFEIKSNLSTQWDNAILKINEIKKLNRHPLEVGEIALLDPFKIPSYVISFKGPKKLDTIYKKLKDIQIKDRPDGIFIIEYGTFYGRVPGGNSVYEAEDPKHAILAFITCIYSVLKQYSSNTAALDAYQELLR